MRTRSPVQRIPSSRAKEILINSPQQTLQRELMFRDQRVISSAARFQTPKLMHIRLPVNSNNSLKKSDITNYDPQRAVREHSQRNRSTEGYIESLHQENVHLNQQVQQLLSQLNNQSQQQKSKVQTVESQPRQLEELKVFKKIYKCAQQDIEDLNAELERYKKLIIQLQSQIQKYEDQKQLIPQDTVSLSDYKIVKEQLQQTYQNLELQINVRDHIINEKNEEIVKLKKQAIESRGRERSSALPYNTSADKLQFRGEIQLQQQLKCTGEQLQLKETQNRQLIDQNAQLQVMIKDLEKIIGDFQQERDVLLENNQKQSLQLNQDQDIQNSNEKELTRLKTLVDKYNSEIEQQREQIEHLEIIRQQYSKQMEESHHHQTLIEKKCEELCERLKEISQELEELSGKYDMSQAELQYQQDSCNQFRAKTLCLQDQLTIQEEAIRCQDDELKLKTEYIQRLEGQLEHQQKQMQYSSQQRIEQSSEIRTLNKQLNELKEEVNRLIQKDIENQEQVLIKQNEILRLNENLKTVEQELNERILFHQSELDSWKEKFIQLNREFHKNQENYMMLNAEFDAVKQRTPVKENQRLSQPLHVLN